MKKLIISLAAVVIAASVQASSFKWSNTGGASNGKIYDGTGSAAVIAQNTPVYLFCTADITQSDLLTAARGASFNIATDAIGGNSVTAVNANGKIDETSAFDYGSNGNTYTFFWATLVGDQILISDTVSGLAQESGTTALSFSGSKTWSDVNKGSAEYSAAGWYAVPEPTSGLMLLLGVGLMALRRRRA